MTGWLTHGDGVFSRHYDCLSLNIGAVICGDGVLVIDTRAHHAQARELLDHVRLLSPAPIGWVVNTHHHWDHTFGNAEFLPAEIWGHQRCAEVLRTEGELMREQVKSQWASPTDIPLFDEVVVTPPDRTFADRAILDLGGRAIELRHLGRGHTDNDIVVVVPDSDVVFAGDLIEEGAPPVFADSFPLEWPAAARALLQLARGPVVPGHGLPVRSGFVETQAEELAEVARLAAARHAEGRAVPDAAAAGGPYDAATMQAAFERAWPALEDGDRPIP